MHAPTIINRTLDHNMFIISIQYLDICNYVSNLLPQNRQHLVTLVLNNNHNQIHMGVSCLTLKCTNSPFKVALL